MYRLDWIEQLKLKLTTAPTARQLLVVSPVVWSLGFTSMLTDISSEMVSSVLPAYLVLHLRMSPLQYGVVDGLYNGFSVALLALVAGGLADRWQRHKEIAAVGYGLSAACKLLLPVSGAWGWIAGVIGLDRAGKSIRTSPRDALISFSTHPSGLASAFAVHRALDAGGALLGPIVAFVLLAQLPTAYDVVWVTSFVFAVLGVAVLLLFVPHSATLVAKASEAMSMRSIRSLLANRAFRALAGCGLLLALTTVSDGFIYLLLQQRGGTPAGFLPLYFVATACGYMLFSIPVGVLADRWGRPRVLLAGYSVLLILYALLLSVTSLSIPAQIGCLALLGLYYAGTEGVLMAMTSAVVPEKMRTLGLALIGTSIGIGKLLSSVLFGWLWSTFGNLPALISFGAALILTITAAAVWLRGERVGGGLVRNVT